MKILKEIINQWGFVTSEQMEEIAKEFPDMKFVIRWGASVREQTKAHLVASRIASVEGTGQDYVRDVFMEVNKFRQLKNILGIGDHVSSVGHDRLGAER
tara:strand:- start:1148 stop:1444 length:297 start_codon:yes stop_codon:yes gene_type:complete